jgi:phage shock protein A
MANPIVKGWRYLMALFGAKIDEHADPKVQIQQAIEDAQRQHQALVQQAAAVIGNQRQLEMRLSRQLSEVERLQSMARQALVLVDRATAAGDQAEATKHEQSARTLATQLVAAEQSIAEAGRADQAAQPARTGQDAGDRRPVDGVDVLARGTGQHPLPGRGAGQDRTAVRQRDGSGRTGR